MKKDKLTVKQENFCNYYIETGNASEAYRRAYSCATMRPETINHAAHELLVNRKVAARVSQLRAELKEHSDITKAEIVKLCTDVVRGKPVTDWVEDKDGRRTARIIPKTWAIERLCHMLGFDTPDRVEVSATTRQQMTLRQAADFIREIEQEY